MSILKWLLLISLVLGVFSSGYLAYWRYQAAPKPMDRSIKLSVIAPMVQIILWLVWIAVFLKFGAKLWG